MQGAARARVSSQCPGWVKSEGLAMSALLPLYTPKADIHRKGRHVAKVPFADIPHGRSRRRAAGKVTRSAAGIPRASQHAERGSVLVVKAFEDE